MVDNLIRATFFEAESNLSVEAVIAHIPRVGDTVILPDDGFKWEVAEVIWQIQTMRSPLGNTIMNLRIRII